MCIIGAGMVPVVVRFGPDAGVDCCSNMHSGSQPQSVG